MNRENVLFGIVGLLLGYVVAFHLVVHMNQNQPTLRTGGASSSADGGEALPTNEVKDRQRLQSAAEQTATTARQNSDSFEAQAAASNAYLEAEEWEKAIEFLRRANALKPDDYGTIVKLGHANSEVGNYEEAEKWFKAALARKPDDGDARSELALTYYLRTPKQPEKAIAELNRGLKENPGHLASLHNLSLLYIETGKLAEAGTTIDKLEQANPTYAQLPRLREALQEAGRKNGPSS
jgi:tetratricopeptide (TPR) repeat protein